MVIVKYCSIDVIEDNCMDHYLSLLPHFMAQDVMKYKYLPDQKSRLIARLMLREALIDTGNEDLLKNWSRKNSNKPIISSWNAFNISHSAKLVVFTYSTDALIGIDIEKKGLVEYQDLMTYFHHEEQQFISASDHANDTFYQIWVRKEAVLKAIGTGIVEGLEKFSCLEDIVIYKGQEWYLKNLNIHPDYICYICLPKLEEHIVVQKFST